MQGKLLRALQDQAVRRVGGNDWIPVNVRIIAATNRDLRQSVAHSEYREDLYYRLNVVAVSLPPLRERPQDIALLAQHFFDKYARTTGKTLKGFAPEALALLAAYHWPGNVRELENAVERAVALCASELIMADDLPAPLRQAPAAPLVVPATRMTMEEVKRWYLSKVLEDVGGNKVKAAEILGVDRGTLYRMLKRQAEGAPDE
jgi:transcriptional regulator with PAS, ATPase and Fis domain